MGSLLLVLLFPMSFRFKRNIVLCEELCIFSCCIFTFNLFGHYKEVCVVCVLLACPFHFEIIKIITPNHIQGSKILHYVENSFLGKFGPPLFGWWLWVWLWMVFVGGGCGWCLWVVVVGGVCGWCLWVVVVGVGLVVVI
jgi:hypothetical protein